MAADAVAARAGGTSPSRTGPDPRRRFSSTLAAAGSPRLAQHRIALCSWRTDLMFGARATLAPAHCLIDGTRIMQEPAEAGADYIHILFNRHELVRVEGVWSESFFPDDCALNAMTRPVREELFALFPDLETPEIYGPTALPCLKPYEVRAADPGLQPAGVHHLRRQTDLAPLA